MRTLPVKVSKTGRELARLSLDHNEKLGRQQWTLPLWRASRFPTRAMSTNDVTKALEI